MKKLDYFDSLWIGFCVICIVGFAFAGYTTYLDHSLQKEAIIHNCQLDRK